MAAIVAHGGDGEAASWLRDHLAGWDLQEGFTPYPDDQLGPVFGIYEEELEIDIITALLHDLSLPLPTTEMLRQFGPVDTPLRIAQLISEMRRLHSEPAR